MASNLVKPLVDKRGAARRELDSRSGKPVILTSVCNTRYSKLSMINQALPRKVVAVTTCHLIHLRSLCFLGSNFPNSFRHPIIVANSDGIAKSINSKMPNNADEKLTITPLRRFVTTARWLIKLRWLAVFGQLATIGVVLFVLGVEIPRYIVMFVPIVITAVSNVLVAYWLDRWRNADQGVQGTSTVMGLVMIMDLLSLTTLLFSSGGPNNPFSLFYLVNLALCAMILPRRWAWGLNALSIACFAVLIYQHDEVGPLHMGEWMLPVQQTGSMSLLQWGYLIAFAMSTTVIVQFITRLADEIQRQEFDLRAAQQQQSRSEKLEALGTLAAGTAHELATPLTTIAMVAREVEQFFERNPPDVPEVEEVMEDIRLIRSQLERCRHILDRMAGRAGQAIGESLQAVTVLEFWEEVLEELPDRDRIRLDVPSDLNDETLSVPVVVLAQAIRGLVQNALDADVSHQGVEIVVKRFANHWLWSIIDRGEGMSAETVRRVSEPFFTTKAPGKGMGLGVFLAKNVLERLDGTVDFQSRPGEGTTATVRIPRTLKSMGTEV